MSLDQISWIVFVQDTVLGSSKLKHNVCVLYTHLKTILVSFNAPSAFTFDGSIIFSLGISSCLANWHEMAWIASGISAFSLALLLPISGMTVMQPWRYISIFT